MPFGFEYWMVYLPDLNRDTFMLFVHNPAGSTKLRDYSSGAAKTIGSPDFRLVYSNTVSGETRKEVEPHDTTDDTYWYGRTLELNSRCLPFIRKDSRAEVPAKPQISSGVSGCSVTPGRAHRGSQRQLQGYVNQHEATLSGAIMEALPSRLEELGVCIRWVSPLAQDEYVEYRDKDFLRAVGINDSEVELGKFWPRGGPCWDALGVISDRNGKLRPGVVLLEAKSHIPEIYGSGCQAGPHSLDLIERSLAAAKQWCGARADSNWTGSLYQSANRLAHLYFIQNRLRRPAWLVNLYFLNDPIGPVDRDEWNVEIQKVKSSLGLDAAVPGAIEIFLPALRDAES